MMKIRKVTVLGGGVLGSQIAYQCAYCGFDVTVWLRSEPSITRTKEKLKLWHEKYVTELKDAKAVAGVAGAKVSKGLIPDIERVTAKKIKKLISGADAAYKEMKFELNLGKAVESADLVIETIAENAGQKTELYKEVAPLLREDTILVTNSSTFLPSMFAEATGRPERYMALHFANSIWAHNTAECMGHGGTSPKVYKKVVAFAKAINMVPLQLHKEQRGYILNSMLVPFLNAAEMLWADGVSDPYTIDLTWRLATGAPTGPFQIIDVVGLNTVYNIGKMRPGADDPTTLQGKFMQMVKEKIDRGETGRNAGKGFYDYNKV